MNHYETLRETVYKILYPEGIPLEFGCEVESDRGEFKTVVSVLGEKVFALVRENGAGESSAVQLDMPYWINLGKPLSIADVLRALGEKNKLSSTLDTIASNGCMYQKGEIILSINLALPLSAPENSEACEALNNLFK